MKRRNLSLALLIAFSTSASAQVAPICGELRARLADLPQVIGNTPEVRRFAGAIAEQNLELRKVRGDLRRNGCTSGSMIVVGGDDADYCGELQQAEARMVDHIRDLQDRRDELRSQSEDIRTRNELMSALDANMCDEESPMSEDPQYAEPPSVQDQAMRNDTFIPLGGTPGRRFYNGAGGPGLSHLNTVCVRTCDGGFFPISSNATSFDFARDADTCSKMCPGIDTELFYHDVSNAETSNMVSTTSGAPYSALPNAFAYKNRKPGEKSVCTCDLPAYYERMRKNQSAVNEPPQSGSITTIQTLKPAATPSTPPAPQASVPDRPYEPGSGKVRQVGPQFLAGDQGTIDLKHPLAPGVQPQQQ